MAYYVTYGILRQYVNFQVGDLGTNLRVHRMEHVSHFGLYLTLSFGTSGIFSQSVAPIYKDPSAPIPARTHAVEHSCL
jgi:hypothetical protein